MAVKDTFDASTFFAALADETRLRLLNLMRNGEVCVCFFAETLKTNNPKISRHLSYLKRADLVEWRRDGKWMHYRIKRPTDANAAKIFDATMQMLGGRASMKEDLKRLFTVCCGTDAPISIRRERK